MILLFCLVNSYNSSSRNNNNNNKYNFLFFLFRIFNIYIYAYMRIYCNFSFVIVFSTNHIYIFLFACWGNDVDNACPLRTSQVKSSVGVERNQLSRLGQEREKTTGREYNRPTQQKNRLQIRTTYSSEDVIIVNCWKSKNDDSRRRRDRQRRLVHYCIFPLETREKDAVDKFKYRRRRRRCYSGSAKDPFLRTIFGTHIRIGNARIWKFYQAVFVDL